MATETMTDESRDYPVAQRVAVMIPLAVFFMGLLPAALRYLSARLDRALHLPRLRLEPVNRLVGSLMMMGGWFLAVGTVAVQLTAGRGTPVPAMAPQTLLVDGPYRFSRNPMVLGTVIMYLGLAVRIGSLSAVGLVVLPTIGLLAYIKRWEEPALEARFGDVYRLYREHTPFLLPRLGSREA